MPFAASAQEDHHPKIELGHSHLPNPLDRVVHIFLTILDPTVWLLHRYPTHLHYLLSRLEQVFHQPPIHLWQFGLFVLTNVTKNYHRSFSYPVLSDDPSTYPCSQQFYFRQHCRDVTCKLLMIIATFSL